MKYVFFDLEGDGLKPTKIHCLSYKIDNGEIQTLTKYEQIIAFFKRFKNDVFIGHNVIRFDFPVLKRILGIEVPIHVIDTLCVSWYRFPIGGAHGLGAWGNKLGITKVGIEDWENLALSEYIRRCEIDVEITYKLYFHFYDYLIQVYNNSEEDLWNMFQFLSFKMECLREQEEHGIPADAEHIVRVKEELEGLIKEKTIILSQGMPVENAKVLKKKPVCYLKKNGELSKNAWNWLAYLERNNLPLNTEIHREPPNPSSPKQLKTWLFSLGWVPDVYDTSKSTGLEVPQVSKDGVLCDSVIELAKKHPIIKHFEGLSFLSHKYGVIKSFSENLDKDNKLYARAHGFTNTLRLRHASPIVNLPKVTIPYGKEIRASLIAPEGYIMCGSDVSGLEDNTKQHYISFFDPDYVTEMRTPGFDPHLDIALLAGLLTEEQCEQHKLYKSSRGTQGVDYSDMRSVAKTVNFASLYLAGPARIASVAGISHSEAVKLHQTYWVRNNAIKKVVANLKIKTVGDQMWLKNPVSGLWLFLKYKKDAFSTLNQSTGSYFFDIFLRFVRQGLKKYGIPVIMQIHDELLLICKKEYRLTVDSILYGSAIKANKLLKLNVDIGISTDWGPNYASCH
ncbi:DNA polymerase [bacterium]|nr:DNA polymerase [bacterium]